MGKSLTDVIEQQEQIRKLIDAGYDKFVDAFLMNETKVFTKNSARLNKSGACRVLGCKPKELENILEACREILGKEY